VARRAPAHPASGITPNRAALCLRAAEHGDMTALVDLDANLEEKDTHLFSELSKRRLALNSPVTLDHWWLPRFVFDTLESEDMTAFADAIVKLSSGMDIGISWIHETLNIPVPAAGEPVLRLTPPTMALSGAQRPLTGARAVGVTDADRADNRQAGCGGDSTRRPGIERQCRPATGSGDSRYP